MLYFVSFIARKSSIAHSNQIVTQLLDSIGGGARLNGFGVVCNEKGLFCLDDDDAGLALVSPLVSKCFSPPPVQITPYLLSVDVVVVCIQCQVFLSRNVKTVDLDLLRCRAILE